MAISCSIYYDRALAVCPVRYALRVLFYTSFFHRFLVSNNMCASQKKKDKRKLFFINTKFIENFFRGLHFNKWPCRIIIMAINIRVYLPNTWEYIVHYQSIIFISFELFCLKVFRLDRETLIYIRLCWCRIH